MSPRGTPREAELEPAPWVSARPERRGAERRSAERRSAPRRTSARETAEDRRAAERRADERRRAQRRSGEPAAARRPVSDHAELVPGVIERRVLLLATTLLLLYGLVMAYSASAAEAYFDHGNSFYYFGRQLLFAVAGVVAMVALSRIDFAVWRRLSGLLYAGAGVLTLLTLVPGIGMQIRGARRWLDTGFVSIQPSEFAKLAVIVLLAALIARRPEAIRTPSGFFRLFVVGILPFGIVVGLLQKDLGTTLVLCVGAATLFIAAGARWRHLLTLALLAVLLVGLLIMVEPYRMERITAFLHPEDYQQTSSFQATQSLLSIASGHVFGVGLGDSVQKFGYLPDQTTDMITGIIGEELGLVGLLLLIGLYVFLAWTIFRIALSCRELFGKLLAVGIGGLIVGQAFINIGAALSVVPLTGVPLPLVSIGGTSLLAVLAGVGILLNIATNRRSFIVVSRRGPDGAARRRRDGGSPVAGARRRR